MTHHDLHQTYNGVIPHAERVTIMHGDYEAYAPRFLQQAHRLHYRRAQDIVRSICVWQRDGEYAVAIKTRMLNVLSHALFDARCTARKIYDLVGGRFNFRGHGSADQYDIG